MDTKSGHPEGGKVVPHLSQLVWEPLCRQRLRPPEPDSASSPGPNPSGKHFSARTRIHRYPRKATHTKIQRQSRQHKTIQRQSRQTNTQAGEHRNWRLAVSRCQRSCFCCRTLGRVVALRCWAGRAASIDRTSSLQGRAPRPRRGAPDRRLDFRPNIFDHLPNTFGLHRPRRRPPRLFRKPRLECTPSTRSTANATSLNS